jgi:glucan phosphoethanolaminetransferase (alkaline phosphatase superfamily)
VENRPSFDALRMLVGGWLLLPAAVIEFYARRYEYAGLAPLPAALAAACFLMLLAPRRALDALPVPAQARRTLCVALVCGTALVLAIYHPFQLVHLLLALLLLCGALLGAWLSPAALALLLAALNFLLILYYGILIVGRETWNQIVSRELLVAYARQLPELIAALPIAPWLPYAAAGALLLALLAAYAACARRIAGEVRRFGSLARTRLAALAAVLAGALLAGQSVYLAAAQGATPDPLLTTLFVTQDRPGLRSMPFDVDPRRAALDRQVAASYAPPPGVARKTLVLITVDSLRADQMNVYGHPRENTPFLNRMLREGRLQRFDNAFAACTESLCGLLAIHNARFWHELGTVNFGLADALKRLGYHNQFLLSGDHANYYGLRSFYGHNIDDYRDASMAEGYVNDDSHVLRWLERIAPADGTPRFLHVHLMSVHMLGKRLAQYRRWHTHGSGAFFDKYHDGILQTDALIEKIFAALQARRLLEDAIVVVTADHGELLGGGGQWGHGGAPLDGAVRVPLLIFDTAGFAYPPRPLASVTDIAPTLLDRIGAPIPAHWSGVSLARPALRKYTVMQAPDRFAVIGSFDAELYKYHYRASDRVEQLVRLGPAGAESAPLPQHAHAEVLRALRAELRARVGALPQTGAD